MSRETQRQVESPTSSQTKYELDFLDTKKITGPAKAVDDLGDAVGLKPNLFDLIARRPVPEIGSSIGIFDIQGYVSIRADHHIYKSWHPNVRKPVALKTVVEREPAFRVPLVEQLRNEGRILAHLNHAGVPRLWDVVTDASGPTLVLEFIEGHSLAELLNRDPVLSPRVALRIATEIVVALEYLAQANIVHRDLKPDNIMLLPNGRVKLIDFGLALERAFEMDEPGPQPAGEYLGTPEYMSPEQCDNHLKVDHRADVYSLGIVLYQCLTSVRPFDDGHAQKVMERQRAEKPAAPHLYNRAISKDLSDLVMRLIAKAPQDRMGDHRRLLAELTAMAKTCAMRKPTFSLAH